MFYKIVVDDIHKYCSEKIMLDILCELSALWMIHMKKIRMPSAAVVTGA